MLAYCLRRLAQTLPLFFLLTLLVFLLAEAIPGDITAELAANPTVSRQTIDSLRQEFGLDRPLVVRYVRWLQAILSGNLGFSYAERRPAVDVISERFFNTLILAFSAFVFSVLAAFPLAMWSARRAGGWPDRIISSLALCGISIPALLASLLLLYGAARSGLFPIGGIGPLDADAIGPVSWLLRRLHHLALPVVVLSAPLIALLVRHLRSNLIGSLSSPHIDMARAKGLPPRRILWVHALSNAVGPMLALLGLALGGLLSGSVVVEKVFSWPGLGSLTVDAIFGRDFFVVMNSVLVASAFLILANLAADIALAWVDPRTRSEKSR